MAFQLINPVPDGFFTDGYGWRDEIPGIAPRMLHDGQDIAAPYGTPILAAHDGIITRKWWDTWASGAAAGGNAIAVTNTDLGIETRYYHKEAQSDLPVGARVRAGDTIGHVGSTGASVGPHLHFSLILGKSGAVDPLLYLPKGEDDMPSAESVAIAILNHPIARKGDGQSGVTTLAQIIAHFDASREDTIRRSVSGVLDVPIKRARSEMGGTTSLRSMLAWNDYGHEVTIRAIFDAAAKANGVDPERFEAAISEAIQSLGLTKEAIADAVVDEQAERLGGHA